MDNLGLWVLDISGQGSFILVFGGAVCGLLLVLLAIFAVLSGFGSGDNDVKNP